MKCVCGYEQGMGWVDNGTGSDEFIEVNPNCDEFQRIKGTFTINCEPMRYGIGIKEVFLYACPECGTVKMVNS